MFDRIDAGQRNETVGRELQQGGPSDAPVDLEQTERAELSVQVVRIGRRARIHTQRRTHDVDRFDVRMPVHDDVDGGGVEPTLAPSHHRHVRRELGYRQVVSEADPSSIELEQPRITKPGMVRRYRTTTRAVVAVAPRRVNGRQLKKKKKNRQFVKVA